MSSIAFAVLVIVQQRSNRVEQRVVGMRREAEVPVNRMQAVMRRVSCTILTV